MKILFVNPPAINELKTQVSKDITEESGFQPPLGVMYIASWLREFTDYQPEIIDSQVEKLDYDQLERRIALARPDVVAMTAMTFTMIDVLCTARRVRKINPTIKIVVGGTHVDIYPAETIRLSEFDYAIRGEGEAPMGAFLDALSGKGSMDDVPGLLYRDSNGEPVSNPSNPPIQDLDTLPFPARDLVPWRDYYSVMTSNMPVGTLITAKGCPYTCTFCYEQGRKPRYRSPGSVVDEMEACVSMGIKEIFIVDDTFYVSKKHSLGICKEILRRGLKVPWGARARVNTVNRDLLERFKEAGCARLHIGVEAGTDQVLKNLNKKMTLDQARRAFREIREVGITALAYFMLGSPGEGIEQIEDTIRFACEIDPDYVQFSRTTPYPATPLYDDGIRTGAIDIDYWREFAKAPNPGFHPRVWTENFTAEELEALAAKAHARFYGRPRYVLRRMKSIRSPKDLSRKVRAGLRILRGARSHNPRLQKLV